MSERTYKLQKGDQVVMHTCMEHDHPDNFGKIWTCRSDEFQHKGHDYGSIFLEGFSGSFSTEFLQKVDVSALVDSLKQQVAQLQEMSKLHTSGAKQLVQDLHTLRMDRDELRKALEEAKTAIQKNLAFANGKDEQSLLSAFNHINTALGE
ncbi:hypothetical protein AAIH69_13700 [Paenibacillus sp. MABNS29]|uniref:hypothetical protein n=1 Tax=Paenibacillus sp. MABNS29 TaxID=3142627 RepID=UPI003D2D2F98